MKNIYQVHQKQMKIEKMFKKERENIYREIWFC